MICDLADDMDPMREKTVTVLTWVGGGFFH